MSVKKIKAAKKSLDLQEGLPSLFERYKAWMEEHPYPILGVVVAGLIVVFVYWGVNSYRGSKEEKARAAYAQVVKDWPGEEASDPKGIEKVLPGLEKFVEQHQGTRSALNARLDLARAYFQVRRYDDALKWGKAVLDETSPKDELKALAQYQIALTSQALGKADEAISQWNALKSEGLTGLGREIDWYLAKLYAGKGDFAKAVEQYEAALKDTGPYPSTAQLQDELSATKLKTASSNQPSKENTAKQEPKG